MIKRLFIIGNGFDSAHGYATRYSEFRKWMEKKLIEAYPDLKMDDCGHVLLESDVEIPSVMLGNHGEEILDENLAIYLLMWLLVNNISNDSDWNNFEAALYDLDLMEIIRSNDWFLEDNARDKEGDINYFHLDADYTSMACDLHVAVGFIRELFAKWIDDVEIEGDVDKQSISKLMDKDSLYLTFNYTETLEKIYEVPGNLIDHIHGLRLRAKQYADANSDFPDITGKLIVGHGSDESRNFDDTFAEMDSILGDTICELRKPVDRIIREHKKFWSRISEEKDNIRGIYSFGFSFGEVDMPYIEKIILSLNGGCGMIWYLNTYGDTDGSNVEAEQKIRHSGFKGSFGRYS